MLGIPEFYLNALPDYRRDTFEFLLCLNEYVQDKKDPSALEQLQSELAPKYHSGFSPDIGDIVLFYACQFNQQREFVIELNAVLGVMKSEQQIPDIRKARDYILRLANYHIVRPSVNPFIDRPSGASLVLRDYLLEFVKQFGKAKNVNKNDQDKLLTSLISPASKQINRLIECYGMHLNQKDPKVYIEFYACICSLLIKIDDMMLEEYLFQLLGEVENVIYKCRDTFPGYVTLDNFAKFRKLMITSKVNE